MCGISGIFAYHAAATAPDEAELLATRDAMRARGPDGSGAWWSADRRCGLGHRRLAILDLSDRASQPMASADGKIVVTFNGEIYNYQAAARGTRSRRRALPHELPIPKRFCISMRATAPRWCTGCAACSLSRSGMRQRRELFLARDPYGIKPLYTANDGWTFRFASQVKALLAGGRVSRDPEPAGIAGFHLFGSVPEPFTLYRDIRALPAGHTQRIDAAGPREPRAFRQPRRDPRRRRSGPRPRRRTGRAPARRRARQRPRPSAGRCRGRDVSLGGCRFRCAARPDGGRRPARDPRHHPRFRRVPRHGRGRSAARRQCGGALSERGTSCGVSASANSARICPPSSRRWTSPRSTASTPGSSRRPQRRPASRSRCPGSAATSSWPAIRALSICRAGAAVSVPWRRCRGSGGWPAR